jgi:hypothetical protein
LVTPICGDKRKNRKNDDPEQQDDDMRSVGRIAWWGDKPAEAKLGASEHLDAFIALRFSGNGAKKLEPKTIQFGGLRSIDP